VPTARGWLLGATGFIVCAAGRIFGTGALEQIGLALLVLVAIAVVVVRSSGHRLHVSRQATPEHCRARQEVGVRLQVTNAGKGRAPLVLLEDRLPAELGLAARFALDGVAPGTTRSTEYRVRPPRRGSYELGPTQMSFLDPFSLARTRAQAQERTRILVHPAIEKLELPRDLGQSRSLSASALRRPAGARGDEFYTLREYSEGDDLRKVHWPSTARRSKYMIRQDETPWRNRVTIMFDDRASSHEGFGDMSSFERTIEAAASIVDLYHRSGYSYRLCSAGNPGLPLGRGTHHFHLAMDLLAMAETSGDEDAAARRLAELQGESGDQATFVAVVARLRPELVGGLGLLSRSFAHMLAVIFPPHRFGSHPTKERWTGESDTVAATRLLARSGIRTIVLGPEDHLSLGWAALARSSPKGGEGRWAPRPEPA
jgi:uncharacterized protein (DUF58 family)